MNSAPRNGGDDRTRDVADGCAGEHRSGWAFVLAALLTIAGALVDVARAEDPPRSRVVSACRAVSWETVALEEQTPKARQSSMKRGSTFIMAARSNMIAGDYERAMGFFDRAIELNTENPGFFLQRGWARITTHQHARAIEDFGQAIALDPNSSIYLFARGTTHSFLGDHDRAIADFDKSIELFPENAIAYMSRGWSYVKKHDYDRGIDDLNRAIQLDPRAQRNSKSVAGSTECWVSTIAPWRILTARSNLIPIHRVSTSSCGEAVSISSGMTLTAPSRTSARP